MLRLLSRKTLHSGSVWSRLLSSKSDLHIVSEEQKEKEKEMARQRDEIRRRQLAEEEENRALVGMMNQMSIEMETVPQAAFQSQESMDFSNAIRTRQSRQMQGTRIEQGALQHIADSSSGGGNWANGLGRYGLDEGMIEKLNKFYAPPVLEEATRKNR